MKEKYINLITELKNRFEKNMNRHEGLTWEEVEKKLTTEKLVILEKMEETGGEPDVVFNNNEIIFFDCSKETPSDRRSLCYDEEALDSRKTAKPKGSAFGLSKSIGINLLTETDYRFLQKFGEFDLKTSSWIETPPDVRKLGGALFCDRRYGKVFTYHNGAESYYASRGFRGKLTI